MSCYIYAADIYCEACAERIKASLDADGLTPNDLQSYDSNFYPKGPFEEGGGESDSPQHCGSHRNCLEAIELENGLKIGKFLGNPLTGHGLAYVRELLADEPHNEVARMWAEFYNID